MTTTRQAVRFCILKSAENAILGTFCQRFVKKNVLLQRARRIYLRGPAYPSPGSVGGAVCAGELKSPKNVPPAVLDTKVWILKSFRCVRWTTRGCHMPPRGGDQADTWPGGRGGEFWQEGMPGGGPLSNGRIVVYGMCPSSPLNVPPLGGGGEVLPPRGTLKPGEWWETGDGFEGD